LNETIFESYMTSSEIEDVTLFNEVAAMVEAEGNTRLICDKISRVLRRPYTSQQLCNYRNYRLGGGDAVSNMKVLLEKFSAFDGSRLLIIRDEEGMTTGIVLQSVIQRAMLERWGDSLLLDWTHNTNNSGYYLGTWALA
jgi:hypothetical protein